jgi:ABC-type arginine transport system ATPase subunit
MAEQLTRDASCQKCKLRDLICLSLAKYDTWPCFTTLEVELRLAQEAVAKLTEAEDRAEEKAEKAIEELQRKPSLASRRLPFLFIGDEKFVIAATLCAKYRHQSQAQF